MKNNFKIMAVSPEFSIEIDSMIKKMNDIFKFPLTKIQASKIVAWKSRNTRLSLNEKRLIEILGVKA